MCRYVWCLYGGWGALLFGCASCWRTHGHASRSCKPTSKQTGKQTNIDTDKNIDTYRHIQTHTDTYSRSESGKESSRVPVSLASVPPHLSWKCSTPPVCCFADMYENNVRDSLTAAVAAASPGCLRALLDKVVVKADRPQLLALHALATTIPDLLPPQSGLPPGRGLELEAGQTRTARFTVFTKGTGRGARPARCRRWLCMPPML